MWPTIVNTVPSIWTRFWVKTRKRNAGTCPIAHTKSTRGNLADITNWVVKINWRTLNMNIDVWCVVCARVFGRYDFHHSPSFEPYFMCVWWLCVTLYSFHSFISTQRRINSIQIVSNIRTSAKKAATKILIRKQKACLVWWWWLVMICGASSQREVAIQLRFVSAASENATK